MGLSKGMVALPMLRHSPSGHSWSRLLGSERCRAGHSWSCHTWSCQ
jgi:hypothetical protein